MFIVIELQVTETNAADILTTHNTLQEAESKFHLILSYAAVSEINLHGAMIIDATDGRVVKYESYNRNEIPPEE